MTDIVLRDYQQRAIDALRASLASGKRRPMLQIPTGGGKTAIAGAVVQSALGKGRRVAFVVPYLGLIDQTVAAFERQGIGAVGVIQAFHPGTDGSQPVQVCSIQTLARRKLPEADLIIVDEAHRQYKFLTDWMRMPEWLTVPFIGLSATPWSRGLGKQFDDLIIGSTMAELIEQGHLCKFEVFAPAHPDLSNVRTVAGDYHEGDLSEAMSKPTLVADVVETWRQLGEDRPTLAFCVDLAHARRVADEFEVAGVSTAYVDANTPRDERERINERLRQGQVKVIASVGTMVAGVDLPLVSCIVLARPTKSEILFVQILGRGMRVAERKQNLRVLDHSDTALRLGMPTDIHHDRLDMGERKTAKVQPREKQIPLPKECPAPTCSYLKPAGVHKCPSCGFAPERQSRIECEAGELVALSGKRKSGISGHSQQQVYSMLIAIAQARGYASGYPAAKFMARYGHWPKGLSALPIEPDAAFLGWLRSDLIRWAKSRAKREAARAGAAA